MRGRDMRTFPGYRIAVRAELNARCVLLASMRSIPQSSDGDLRALRGLWEESIEALLELLTSTVTEDRARARRAVVPLLTRPATEEGSLVLP